MIAAVSGRALAQAACRAGYRALVADFFGDEDTLAAADGFARLPGSLHGGVDGARVLDALCRLAVTNRLLTSGERFANLPPPLTPPHKGEGVAEVCTRHLVVGGRDLSTSPSPLWGGVRGGGSDDKVVAGIGALILGSGFERMPELVDELARDFPLAGNSGNVIRRIKSPAWLAQACEALAIPHPEILMEQPVHPENWVAKTAGGAGGTHVRQATGDADGAGRYFQRRISGDSISALFVADRDRAHIVGFSKQWTSPTPNAPYRYGGGVRLRGIERQEAEHIGGWLTGLTRRAGLVGLCSADFIRHRGRYWLIEINPRPGATLDIFDAADAPLLKAHIAACRGEAVALPRYRDSAASLIAYAAKPMPAFPQIEWPDWAADRQSPGTSLRAGDPICTVFGFGATAREAMRQARERLVRLQATWSD